jgi:hypothetical protein
MSYVYFSVCVVTLALLSGARAANPAYNDLLDDIYQYRSLGSDGYFDTIPAFEDLQKPDNEPTDAIPDDMSYYPYGWEGDDQEEEPDIDLASIGLTDPYGYEEAEDEDRQEYEPQDPLQLRSTNELRDPELLENSALWGTHYVSGTRAPKVTSLVARQVRATLFASDSRCDARIRRESGANDARTCHTRCAQQGMLLLDPSSSVGNNPPIP